MTLNFTDTNITFPVIQEVTNKISIGTGSAAIAMIIATVLIIALGQMKIRTSKLVAFPVSITLYALGLHLPLYWLLITAALGATTVISLEAIGDIMTSGYWAVQGQREKAKSKRIEAQLKQERMWKETTDDAMNVLALRRGGMTNNQTNDYMKAIKFWKK